MRVILSLLILFTLTSCVARPRLQMAPEPMCPTVPEGWTEPTPPPAGQLPATYGALRLYTLDALGQLAVCNADKAEIARRVNK